MEGTVAVGIVKDVEKKVVAIPGHGTATKRGKK
jgi:hypothetical protein